jgi:hypothetical protein
MPWPNSVTAHAPCDVADPFRAAGGRASKWDTCPRLRGPHKRQTQVFLLGEWQCVGAASRRPHEPCNIHADIVDRLQKPSAQYMGGIC